MLPAMDPFTPFIQAVTLAIAALLPIVNPMGSVPLFLQLTSDFTPAQRSGMAKSVAINSFLLLLASTLVGAYVLDFFGLSIPAVQVGGGLLVCAMGWNLLNGPDAGDHVARTAVREVDAEDLPRRAFYPLTMPLTVGPGSISVAVTLGASPEADVRALLVTTAGHVVGIFAVAASVALCYRYADAIMRKAGYTGRIVVMRLSAFIVLCIGVQIAWNGIRGLLATAFPHIVTH